MSASGDEHLDAVARMVASPLDFGLPLRVEAVDGAPPVGAAGGVEALHTHGQYSLLGRFYSEDQPRDESGRWGDGGGGDTKDGDTRVVSSEGGRTTVEVGTHRGAVVAVFHEGSGWSHTDKDVAGIAAAVADHAPPGTSLRFGGNDEVGTAAVDPSNPSTIMVGDRDIGDRNWAKAEQKDEFYRELDGSRWLIPEAFTGNRWEYTIAHESGHVAHLTGSDPDGKAKDVTAAIRAAGEAGMSTYGNSHPFEAIAESHAAWSLAGRPESADEFRDRPAVRATVVAMGWAS